MYVVIPVIQVGRFSLPYFRPVLYTPPRNNLNNLPLAPIPHIRHLALALTASVRLPAQGADYEQSIELVRLPYQP